MATRKNDANKVMISRKPSDKKVMAEGRASKKKTSKKPIAKKRGGTSSKKTIATKGHASRKQARKKNQRKGPAFEKALVSRSGARSGDLQGLRDMERADSESVAELLEEGNAFEASVVTGVEDAEDDQEKEVHTHEVLEDDVPEEYQDKD